MKNNIFAYLDMIIIAHCLGPNFCALLCISPIRASCGRALSHSRQCGATWPLVTTASMLPCGSEVAT
jgi:hypothetical protein